MKKILSQLERLNDKVNRVKHSFNELRKVVKELSRDVELIKDHIESQITPDMYDKEL